MIVRVQANVTANNGVPIYASECTEIVIDTDNPEANLDNVMEKFEEMLHGADKAIKVQASRELGQIRRDQDARESSNGH